MASRKNQSRRRGRKSSSSSSSSSSKRRRCKGGRGKRTEKKHNKWHQKGCQSGGGGVTGGWPWAPSDVHHTQTAGSAGDGVPQAINGNHYSLNTKTMAPPQNSNHLVEQGQVGGAGTKKNRKNRGRRHRRFIGEQHGGMAQYLPDVANTSARSIAEMPASVMNSLQGASTAFKTSDPTIQPIGNAVQLA